MDVNKRCRKSTQKNTLSNYLIMLSLMQKFVIEVRNITVPYFNCKILFIIVIY